MGTVSTACRGGLSPRRARGRIPLISAWTRRVSAGSRRGGVGGAWTQALTDGRPADSQDPTHPTLGGLGDSGPHSSDGLGGKGRSFVASFRMSRSRTSSPIFCFRRLICSSLRASSSFGWARRAFSAARRNRSRHSSWLTLEDQQQHMKRESTDGPAFEGVGPWNVRKRGGRGTRRSSSQTRPRPKTDSRPSAHRRVAMRASRVRRKRSTTAGSKSRSPRDVIAVGIRTPVQAEGSSWYAGEGSQCPTDGSRHDTQCSCDVGAIHRGDCASARKRVALMGYRTMRQSGECLPHEHCGQHLRRECCGHSAAKTALNVAANRGSMTR
jgi:hypothetical protein